MVNQKRDPYKHKEKWGSWKEKIKKDKNRIKEISKHNSDLILEFLHDMELGKNISPFSKKGERSYIRLNTLKSKLIYFSKVFNQPLDKLTQDKIHSFFKDMREGKIKRNDGKEYLGVGNYVKDFKSFWGWLIRVGKVEKNITQDLSRSNRKPAWVFLTENQFKKLVNRCNPDYKALTWFMYDTGLRVTEAYSIKIKNFNEDYTELTIPEEVAKTFGRTIKLKLCTNLIKEYIKYNDLQEEDYLFIKKPSAFNKYIKNLAKKILGNKETKARKTYDQFTLYDIRHNSSCYWLKRYDRGRSLMYRMGWKKEEMILYYSEFLGLRDEIRDEDMILTEDKSGLEKLKYDMEKMKMKNDLLFRHFENYQDLLNDMAETGKMSIQIKKQTSEESKDIKDQLIHRVKETQ